MTAIDRRTFLKAAGASMAASLIGAPAMAAPTVDPPKDWKKAYMLSGALRADSLEREFQALKDAGFDGVEIASPNELDPEAVVQARDRAGLIVHGVSGSRHWKDTLGDPDPEVVARGLAAVRKELADCQAYGGTTVLLVPAVVRRDVSHRDAYSRSQAAIRTLIPDAERSGVKIAIEEVWNKFLLTAPEFSRYIDEFQTPWIGAYFDVGNVAEYGYPEEWIRELGGRILKVHIKEYAKEDRFEYPLGEGVGPDKIDWSAVRQALIDVGYRGWITAEVPKGDAANLKDVVRRMNDLLGMG